MSLEYKDVQFFKVRQTRDVPTVSIEISGLAFHSSLAVKSIEVKTEDDGVTIIVNLTPSRKGLTGNFLYDLDIPKTVNAVYFGPTKHLIWERGVGIVE